MSCLVTALEAQQQASFAEVPVALPCPHDSELPYSGDTFELPFILVPPEAMDLEDGLPALGGEIDGTKARPPAKQDYPYCYLSLFPADVSLQLLSQLK